jgi:hypothetical protein
MREDEDEHEGRMDKSNSTTRVLIDLERQHGRNQSKKHRGSNSSGRALGGSVVGNEVALDAAAFNSLSGTQVRAGVGEGGGAGAEWHLAEERKVRVGDRDGAVENEPLRYLVAARSVERTGVGVVLAVAWEQGGKVEWATGEPVTIKLSKKSPQVIEQQSESERERKRENKRETYGMMVFIGPAVVLKALTRLVKFLAELPPALRKTDTMATASYSPDVTAVVYDGNLVL